MLKDSEQLLYVISAKKEMPWISFKEAFDDLYKLNANASSVELDGINDKRFPTVRALDSLGHCDFDFNENVRKVYAAPPVLVRLPCAGFPQAILAGARSPQTIEQLLTACKHIGNHINVEIAEQPGELALVPVRVVVQAEEVRELEAIASSLKIAFNQEPAAWSLLHFAASIDDYLAILQWETSPELTWKRQTFDPCSLQFRHDREIDINIRLSQYSHPSRNTKIHYLWQHDRCTQIDRDWGRYAVLKAAKLNVIVYDRQRFIMAVPVGVKLPRLLERALTLCSGYVTKFVDNLPVSISEKRGFNLFRDIPPQIAEMTAAKVGQTLSLHSLNLKI